MEGFDASMPVGGPFIWTSVTGVCPENKGGHSLPPGSFRMYRVERVLNKNWFLFKPQYLGNFVNKRVWMIHRICPPHNTNGFTNDHSFTTLLPHMKYYGTNPISVPLQDRVSLWYQNPLLGDPNAPWPSCVWYGISQNQTWSYLRTLGVKNIRKISQDRYEASALILRNQAPIQF